MRRSGFHFLIIFLFFLRRYISCVNKFFATRTAHGILEAISFESLGAVKSHLSQISPLKQSILSNQSSPLVHFTLLSNPSSYGTIHLLHSTPIPSLFSPQKLSKSSQIIRSSVVTVHTSGIKCNALIYHHNVKLEKQLTETDSLTSGSIQMTLKVAGDVQIPVLQAGLYVLTETSLRSDASYGLLPSHSVLDFTMEVPTDSHLKAINIAEVTLNKLSANVTAKIIQSELSTDPILTWPHVDSHLRKKMADDSLNEISDSELSNNAIAVNINVPSVRLQIGGPSRGIPTVNDVCIDPAIIVTFVRVWKPLIEHVINSGRSLWRNKIMRDRRLLLALITSAMEGNNKPNVTVSVIKKCFRILFRSFCRCQCLY